MAEFIEEREGASGVTYRLSIPYYVNGKRTFYHKSFSSKKYGGKKIALELAKEHRDLMRKQLNVDNIVLSTNNYTLDKILELSFDYFPLSYETKRKHIIYVNRYIKPFTEGLAFKDIKSGIIQKSLNAMVETSSQDEINRIFSIWKKLYKTAIITEVVYIDITLKVTVPKSNKITKPRKAETNANELMDISKALFERTNVNDALLIYVALWVMYYTGMRPAEVYALEWENIERNNKTIFVCQQIGSNNKEKNVIVKTKTKTSVRTVPYTSELDSLFDLLDGKQYLFKRKNGEFLNGTFVSCVLRRVSDGKFRAYMLRHQFSTDLIMSKIDIRTIQELMGHSSASMSLEYARSNEEAKNEAIKKRQQCSTVPISVPIFNDNPLK